MTSFRFAADSPILVGQFDSAETARAVASELHAVGYGPQDIDQFAFDGVQSAGQAEPTAEAEMRAALATAARRPAGVRVAVRVPGGERAGRVLGVFARHEVRSIEQTRGVWRDGQWHDFDPVSVPQWIMPPRRRDGV